MADLVLFDLDHTLLSGDSDFSWGEFLCEIDVVDEALYHDWNAIFYEEYKKGTLDMEEYLRFALQPLAQNDMNNLLQWRQRFIEKKIKPMITSQALALVRQHLDKGDIAVIITSTNAFITEPIGELFGIKTVIATQPRLVNGRFDGTVEGAYCFKEGKLKCLQQWLDEAKPKYRESWFYSDSHNDIPLLTWVDHPVVVNGDEQLIEHAQKNNWQSLSI